MKILTLITDRVSPAVSATRVRNLNLWSAIKKSGVELKVLGIDSLGEKSISSELGVEYELLPYTRQSLPIRAANSLLFSYHQWPKSSLLKARVQELVDHWQPDIVHAEELRMANYLPGLNGRSIKGKQSVTFHNVESELCRKTGSTAFQIGKPLIEFAHQINLKEFESKVASNTDICFAYSPVDLKKYSNLLPQGNWDLTSGGVAIKDTQNIQDLPPSVLLVGTLNYMPNLEGIYWFNDHIRPLLPENIKITIAGSKASENLKRYLIQNEINFLDTPVNLESIYQDHTICIVPLLSGSGTRGKILEAMGQHKLVVSTPIGAEGLSMEHGRDILIGDSPEKFAQQILLAINNKALRLRISNSAFDHVKTKYSWDIVAKNLLESWNRVIRK